MTTARISGYAALTSTPYKVGSFTETIAPGAFKRTLQSKPDCQLLINHSGLPLARTTAGSLRLTEDDRGLHFDADVDPARTDVSDLLRAMRSGAIDQCSFAFIADQQEWSEDRSKRLLKQVSIHRGDCSIVSMAANEGAVATVADAPSMDPRAAAAAIGRNIRGTTPFECHMVESAPGPERRARGEVGMLLVELEPRFGRAATRALALPTTTTWKGCTRCGKAGKITLNGRKVTCPLCLGKGAARVSSDAPMKSTQSDGSSRAKRIEEARRLKKLGITLRGFARSTCPICDGKGTIGPNKTGCPKCGGSGKVVTGQAAGPKTDGGAGLTVKTCRKCGGKGRILQPTGGKKRCDGCGGSGKVVTGKIDSSKVADPYGHVAAHSDLVSGGRSMGSLLGIEVREKYDAAQLDKLRLAGKTFSNTTSYPVDDLEDLQNAIRAVGRGKADHDAIRAYVIRRAKALGLSSKIPDNWNSDGSLAASRSFRY